MIPILYKTISEGTVPAHYGVGPLTSCLGCTVTEERNGAYELSLTYPANGIHAEEITPNAFIMAKPNYMDSPQIFRINKVGKTMAGKFTVTAYHISYDLSGKVIESGSAGSCAAACVLLTAQAGNFAITTDKAVSGQFSVSQPSSVRSWLGGKEGSLLDVYGGEWAYDNYTAKLMGARGADRHVTIRYGKNLTQLSQELDMSNLVTGIIPFYVDQNGNKTVGARVDTGLQIDVTRDVAIDFSQDVNPESATPIATQLAALATAYKNNNNLTTIGNSITLDFVQSGKITERVDLCDIVSIYFEALGITAKAKCVKTVWDVLEDRYTKTVFGDARTNITDTIAKNAKEISFAATKSEVSRATELITGNRGGYVVLHDSDGDDLPDEILIMDTPDINTATKIWRWNKAGLGYSDHGYNGPYGLAMTSDGEIDADFIKVGVISDVQGNSTIDMTNGAATMNKFKARDRFSLINSSSAVKAMLDIDSAGNTLLYMRSASQAADLVKIWANDANGAGVFQLLKANGNMILEAGQTPSGGGGCGIRNASGVLVGRFESIGGGAFVGLYDDAAVANIYGYGSSGQLVCVSLVQTSSRKVKDNIKPIDDADKILELEAVKFDYKNKALGTDKRGFIAEDVAGVLPNLVTPEADGRPASLDYIGMIPYLQAVIKEQDARIKALEDKLNGTV